MGIDSFKHGTYLLTTHLQMCGTLRPGSPARPPRGSDRNCLPLDLVPRRASQSGLNVGPVVLPALGNGSKKKNRAHLAERGIK